MWAPQRLTSCLCFSSTTEVANEVHTPCVEARIVHESTGGTVVDWTLAQPGATSAATVDTSGSWSINLKAPAGGLYRLETRLRLGSNPAGEWSPRGDMRHFLGVGDVWVITGQSNSAGYGRGPYEDPPELGVHLFKNDESWGLATHPMNESTDTKHVVNREGANPGHSPYLHFGRLLQRALGHPIGLIATSLGGSPLSMWDPTDGSDAVLYDNMLHCIRQAGVGGNVRGVLWYQGESDTGTDALTSSYAARFGKALAAWRDALNPDLLAVTVQLNRTMGVGNPDQNRRWTQLREQQRLAAAVDNAVAIVPSFDCSLTDGIHNSPAGNMVLGDRMANAALSLCCSTRFATVVSAPEPSGPASYDQSSDIVTLHFESVTSRIGTIDPTANPFVVEDQL